MDLLASDVKWCTPRPPRLGNEVMNMLMQNCGFVIHFNLRFNDAAPTRQAEWNNAKPGITFCDYILGGMR